MKKLIGKYNVSKGVVYNIRYDLQKTGKLPYLRRARKDGKRRGGVPTKEKFVPTPDQAKKPTRSIPPPPPPPPDWKPLPPPPSVSKPLPPPPPEFEGLGPKSKKKVAKKEMKKEKKKPKIEKVVLPKTEEPTLDRVEAAIRAGENEQITLFAHFGKDVDPVLMDLIWNGKVIETAPGKYHVAGVRDAIDNNNNKDEKVYGSDRNDEILFQDTTPDGKCNWFIIRKEYMEGAWVVDLIRVECYTSGQLRHNERIYGVYIVREPFPLEFGSTTRRSGHMKAVPKHEIVFRLSGRNDYNWFMWRGERGYYMSLSDKFIDKYLTKTDMDEALGILHVESGQIVE